MHPVEEMNGGRALQRLPSAENPEMKRSRRMRFKKNLKQKIVLRKTLDQFGWGKCVFLKQKSGLTLLNLVGPFMCFSTNQLNVI